MRYRLLLEYQGTRYHGWQGQENVRTVQGTLLRAAREALGVPVGLQGSGRTDAGVHALGQVAHLEVARALAVERIARGINDHLPADINVLDVRRAEPRFHARHHAIGRSYLYQVSRRRTAFAKPFVWWVRDDLDVGPMRRAAAGLAGLRDCASFADRRVDPEVSTKVLIQEATLVEDGELILVRLRASHFLWKMVRRIVGCLVGLGRGEISADEFEGFFAAPTPYPARVTAPPSGLFLEEVIYPGERFRRPLVPVLGVPPAPGPDPAGPAGGTRRRPPATTRGGRGFSA